MDRVDLTPLCFNKANRYNIFLEIEEKIRSIYQY